ncbi:MAG: 2-hydroxyacid dehydrogenase [Trueperaceae bacterium]
MSNNIFITRRVPHVGIKLLQDAGFKVEVHDSDLPIERSVLLERLCTGNYKALLTTLSDKVNDELLNAAPNLKIVANFAVGYDNIDVPACTKRNVLVSNTPGVLSEATADQAFALILAVARRVVEGHTLVTHNEWLGWAPMQLLGQDITAKTLGIIGMGRIGYEVAKRAKGFDMKVLYFNRNRNLEAEARLEAQHIHAQHVDLATLLKGSDVISIHCPYSKDTHHLIGESEFNQMKPNAILVNTARGPIVHEAALVKALQEKRLWGAGLDVFEFEPEVMTELKTMSNVTLAPHLGSATEGTRDAMITLAVEAIVAVLDGKGVPHLLNGSMFPG